HAHELRHSSKAEAGGGPDEVLAGIPLAIGGQLVVPLMKAAAEVEPGAERASGPAHYDYPDRGIGDRAMNRGFNLIRHRRHDRIEPVRAVERNRRDRIIDLVQQRFVRWVSSSRSLGPRFLASLHLGPPPANGGRYASGADLSNVRSSLRRVRALGNGVAISPRRNWVCAFRRRLSPPLDGPS